ncbi:thiamine pyrophosphate-binding protein [Sporosarcina sp. Marseille-Q4063]|uniref:thiamine pyrophosphate-binding protein n=1 Tax=Sporosarcina sp. Marseille-Q4063 TaxID=2810514 RepID=UPI001BAF5CC1|nr:thiamine pyrophosphate-binding protein [Sporosarcina sp. Marseille-Q4063]QUW21280.1 thiamine pyrophosphate-binding protein [Sporosarcina sp. Marseille-Q4063]
MLAVDKMCDIIEESDIEYVFGIQGGITYRLFNALGRRGKVKLVIARHEQSAALMAAAYGRLTGKPAILMGQGPFIASSGAFGILEAYMCGYPMIVIADAVTNSFGQKGMIQSGTGEYGSYDLQGVLKTMTKHVGLATTPKQAIHGLQDAIKHTTAGRKGPTGLVIYQPEVYEEFDEEEAPLVYSTNSYISEPDSIPSKARLDQVADYILQAENPVIIAGNGVHMSQAYEELKAFSEQIGAPVATTYKGKSVIEENHKLAVGMMGDYGQLTANTAIGKADLILVLGSKLGASDTSSENLGLINPKMQKIIQFDIDEHRAGWTYPVSSTVIGDLKLTLPELMKSLAPKILADEISTRMKKVSTFKDSIGYFSSEDALHESSPVYPQRIIGLLNEMLPEDVFLTMDAGSNRAWTTHLYQCKSAGSILVPGGIAGMGSGIPFAVAAKMVYPDRQVVSIIGDGGMGMTNNVISTSVQYNLPIIVIVMNDSRLGMPAARQGDDRISTDFIDTDFAKIAEGYGANGVRVENSQDLKEAIKAGLESNITTVIDVRIDVNQKYTIIQPITEEMQKYKKGEVNPYTENAFF